MKKCPRCGSKVSSNSKFCPHCGLNFDKYQQEHTRSSDGQYITCPRCGNQVLKRNKFCPYCGYNLDDISNISNNYHDYRSNNVSYNDKVNNDVHPGQKYANVAKTRDPNSVWIKKEFSISLIMFWIKGWISVDYRGIHIRTKNTVLGFIPAGDDIQDIPLRNVSGSNITTQYKVGDIIFGVIIAICGFSMLASSALMALIVMIIGIGLFSNGITTQLSVEMSGNSYQLSVPFINKSDLQLVNSVINQANETEENKGDMSLYWDRKR